MVSQKLAIKQFKPAHPQPRDQPDQRHFGGIGRPRKHTLAKKSPAHRHAIKPADQLIALPTLHAVRHARSVERQKCILDIAVDPRLAPVILIFRTFRDHLREGRITAHAKAVLPDYFGKRLADPQFIQRQNSPPLRLHPECIRIIACIGHGKHTVPVCAEQQFEINGHARQALSRVARLGNWQQTCFPSPNGRGYAGLRACSLAGVGEGLCPIDGAQPLTQLRVSSKLPTLRNPLPKERGSICHSQLTDSICTLPHFALCVEFPRRGGLATACTCRGYSFYRLECRNSP